ncbi:MAG: DUF4169 family protein [Pseudomonadota bacterium]
MPGDVINLRIRRKRAQRLADKAKADTNAIRHGQPKAVARLEDARRAREDRALDGHRLERQREHD